MAKKTRYFKQRGHGETEFTARGLYDKSTESYPVSALTLNEGGYQYGAGYGGGYDPGYLRANQDTKSGDQLKLFDARPSKITLAMADHRMRTHTPTVIGMAINEANKIGMGLTYDADLSAHSSKIVKKGLDLGIVASNRANPKGQQTNTIAEGGLGNFTYTRGDHAFTSSYKIKPDEVKAGRETIRGVVRQGLDARKLHLSPQFEDTQMKLPGFD
jgi:hypothetical protein